MGRDGVVQEGAQRGEEIGDDVPRWRGNKRRGEGVQEASSVNLSAFVGRDATRDWTATANWENKPIVAAEKVKEKEKARARGSKED